MKEDKVREKFEHYGKKVLSERKKIMIKRKKKKKKNR